ncbi:polyprenyl synthetase family protein [Streptomyces sp. NPDC001177]
MPVKAVPAMRHASDHALSAFLELEEHDMLETGLRDHLDLLRPFFRGGKHLRSQFCYWAWKGAGAKCPMEHVAKAAAALELLHSTFLIHDDVLDQSETRRGTPAYHRQWADRHRSRQWSGNSDRFGENAALVAGDFCFNWCNALIASSTTSDRLATVLGIFFRMSSDASYGQMLELHVQADRNFDPARCLKVAEYKAGRYMIAPPLQIGAALAGAPEQLIDAYGEAGRDLGTAYQLRDDLIGVFGDPAVTGKPNIDDLREGKPTVLFATALQLATEAQRKTLLNSYGRPDITPDTAHELRALIASTGAQDAVEEAIQERHTRAVRTLNAAPITGEGREELLALAHAALQRAA